jgi:hypothetical protein
MSFGRAVLGGTSLSNTVTGFAVHTRGRIRQPAQQPRLMLLFGPAIFSARRCAHANFCKIASSRSPSGSASRPRHRTYFLTTVGSWFVTRAFLSTGRHLVIPHKPSQQFCQANTRFVGDSNIRIIRFGGT